MNEIYEQPIGLILGLINEKNNELAERMKKEASAGEEVIVGNAEMLAML